MFTFPPRRATLVALLFLLIIGCAWASERPERRNESGLGSCNHKISNTAEWREMVVTNTIESVASESTVTGTMQGKVNDGQAKEPQPSPPQGDVAAELQLRRRKTPTSAEAAQITTPPLLRRQDQAQIDQLNSRIQSLQESAQAALQALSAASRSVSQASQQLSQSSQQLSQDSSRLSASSLSLAFALSLATQSEASLTGALSAAISSGNSAFASCTSSAASALAVASGDAVTKVGAALAQVTNARVSFFFLFSLISFPPFWSCSSHCPRFDLVGSEESAQVQMINSLYRLKQIARSTKPSHRLYPSPKRLPSSSAPLPDPRSSPSSSSCLSFATGGRSAVSAKSKPKMHAVASTTIRGPALVAVTTPWRTHRAT